MGEYVSLGFVFSHSLIMTVLLIKYVCPICPMYVMMCYIFMLTLYFFFSLKQIPSVNAYRSIYLFFSVLNEDIVFLVFKSNEIEHSPSCISRLLDVFLLFHAQLCIRQTLVIRKSNKRSTTHCKCFFRFFLKYFYNVKKTYTIEKRLHLQH